MERGVHHRVDWKQLFAQPGFRWLFSAMFVSLFGSGMNWAGVTWYLLQQTGSPVAVSLMSILMMLPGLVVPPFGGVLIDRVDRRYLGLSLDLARAGIVLGTAALIFLGRAQLWHVYAMVTLLGVGFAIYWSTTNALVQEVMPRRQLGGANAVVLIAVQGGLMSAGALVGFFYERAGISGILAMDGGTYLFSALCLTRLRRGYFHPRHALRHETEPLTIEAPHPRGSAAEPVIPPVVELGIAGAFVADLKEGLRYLRTEARVLALGLTYACMMAGVISSNVLVVVLANNVLHAGPRGYGLLEAGWAVGAITGGLSIGAVTARHHPFEALIVALGTLAVGHTLFPYARWLAMAVAMMALFGGCRAWGGVLTQSTIMTIVPRRLMGRTQSAFSVLSTMLQVLMSFSLGWLAEHIGLRIAFVVLGMLYGGATLAAVRARRLTPPAPHPG